MPELPEVERAAGLIRSVALGKTIIEVETAQDEIVYSGITHEEFASEIKGRIVKNVGRYGKVFYIELEGEGRIPVLHFGMTGMLQIKGQLATYYKETPKKASTDWPPRFMKFILHIRGSQDEHVTELAFLDARRLGRIRLCKSPLSEPPISALGFDPILCMPVLEDFKRMVHKRSCPVKALLLDQSFSAGVGNWVADEVLYHARIHPEHRCNTLSEVDLAALHKYIGDVCKTAVEANADDTKFPEHWLFKHRWGKGKKKHTLILPSGEPATIKWITVGGRTSAYVEELQRLSPQQESSNSACSKKKGKRKALDDNDGDDSEELASVEDTEHNTGAEQQQGNSFTAISKSKFFPVHDDALSGTRRVTRQMSRSTTTAALQETMRSPKKKRRT